MKYRVYFIITIFSVALYFSAMYFGTTITIQGLEEEYHLGNEIKFTAQVRGFGDAVPAYMVEFQSKASPGFQMGGESSTSSVDTTYLNFPMPFEKTINYSYITNINDDRSGSYIMKFSTLGHTVEKKVTLLP